MLRLHAKQFSQLDAMTLHNLIRLRVDVFVVEQNCPYPELDGRDAEPNTVHLWLAQDTTPVAYLRILSEPDGVYRVGRVVTAESHRGQGLAVKLMTEALERTGDATVVLDAQTYLRDWYTKLGFHASGPEFVEDGIAHVPMQRSAG